MLTRIVGISLLALVLAACADETPSQLLVQNQQQAATRDQRPLEDERRQRTLSQSESGRIYNQGALR